MKKLTLVIPCYNEEQSLEDCIRRVLKLQSNRLSLELIIVDDCSKDNSLRIARELQAAHKEIRVFAHEINRGKGAALQTGFIHATGDYIGIQDADNEYTPSEYLELLEPLLDGRADVVYGSRYLRPDTRKVLYFWHTWMNKSLTFISNMFTNLDISDMETCYKLFRRDVIQEIAPQLKEKRFGFEPEITALVANKKYRVWECAISYNPRSYEEGKKIGWKDGLHALYCILHYSAPTAPLPMQLILYFFIGCLSALANLLFFWVFHALTPKLLVATSLAFLGAALVNYFLCIAILFRHRVRWKSGGELAIYFSCAICMLLLDYYCTVGLIACGLSAGWAKFWSSGIGFIGNFLFRKYVVF